MDDLRAAQKTYLDSPAGRDFMARVISLETDLTLQAYRAEDPYAKAALIDEQKGVYKVRTLLAELAQPKSKPAMDGKVHSSHP